MKKPAVLLFLFFLLCGMPTFALCLEIIPRVSAGGVTDSGMNDNYLWRTGVAVSGSPWRDLSMEVSGAYAEYRARYYALPYGSALSGLLSSYGLTEQRTDYSGVLSYPVLQGDITLALRAGYHGIHLKNSMTSFDFGGPLAGISAEKTFPWGSAELRVDAARVTDIRVINHTQRVFTIVGSRTISIFGDPVSMTDYGLTFWRPLEDKHRIGLGFEGETLFFQRRERYYYEMAVYYAY
jgi:hypothetical protein